MSELYSVIEIGASPERVWQLLTEFSRFHEWNPFIPRASGQIKPGERIQVTLKPPKGSAVKIKPKLVKVETNHELRWLGHLGIPGLFDGEHIMTIEPLDKGRARFVHRERFKGVLSPLMLGLVAERTLAGFRAMNQALKVEAEKQTQEG